MTIRQCIDFVRNTKDIDLKDTILIKLISDLDLKIKDEIIIPRENTELNNDLEKYDTSTPTDTVLLVPDQYSMLYVYWLYAQADYMTEELERYTNDMIMFNSIYDEFKKAYTRKYRRTETTQFQV